MTPNVKIALMNDFNNTNQELERLILKASDIEVAINCVPGYAPHEITTRNIPSAINPISNSPIFPDFTPNTTGYYNPGNKINPTLKNVQTGRPVQPSFNNITNNESILKEVNEIKEANKSTEPTDKEIEELYNIYHSIIHFDVNDNDLGYSGDRLTLRYMFEHDINPKFVYHLFGSIYNHKQKPDGFTHMFMKKFYTLLVKDLYKNLLEFEHMLKLCDCSPVVPERILNQLKEMNKRL